MLDDLVREIVRDEIARLGLDRPTEPVEPDEWLDSKEAADYLGLSTGALHNRTGPRARARGDALPHHYLGSRLRFRRSELDAHQEGSIEVDGLVPKVYRGQPHTNGAAALASPAPRPQGRTPS